MVYGLLDDLAEERKARHEAISLLLAVAKNEKTVLDVRAWLEKEYPELCFKTTKRKKWLD